MNFDGIELSGAYIVRPKIVEDSRGFFARTYCREEFKAKGLECDFVQCNVSFNHAAGTVRGLHYQAEPHAEVKIVRCVSGAIFDVIVDLRPESPTFRRWYGLELTAENRLALYIPKGFAHGFQTLADQTEVFYQMANFYHPESAAGIRWNDPSLGIPWPRPVVSVSERDSAFGWINS